MIVALSAQQSWAEQEFYTWVDEMGRVHNTPIKSNKPKESNSATSSVKMIEVDGQEYLTEDGLKQQTQKDQQERPPFFTWLDGQGNLRSEIIPQVDIEVEEAQQKVTDHALLESLRMPNAESIECCESFASRFKQQLQPLKSLVLIRPLLADSMPTMHGNKPAWYVTVPKVKTNEQGNFPVLSLKVRGTEAAMAMIVLDRQFKPLHYLSKLHTQRQPETWRSVAYDESLISMIDEDVYALIIYFIDPVDNQASLELKWQP